MALELIAAALVGVAALWLVLHPLFVPPRARAVVFEPLDPEETPKGVALTALKEIEFDRETGKLSDADYELLKRKYTAAALDALRLEEGSAPADLEEMIAARVRAIRSAPAGAPADAPACPACGPRPEVDALFCSACGQRLAAGTMCEHCGTALAPGSQFCEGCGVRVAA
jgi:hypothetical protein